MDSYKVRSNLWKKNVKYNKANQILNLIPKWYPQIGSSGSLCEKLNKTNYDGENFEIKMSSKNYCTNLPKIGCLLTHTKLKSKSIAWESENETR